jgi:hypothetical protein
LFVRLIVVVWYVRARSGGGNLQEQEIVMRLGLLLVAVLGISVLIAALIAWPRDWVVSFYLPMVLGCVDALAVWSVILAAVRSRRHEATRAYLPVSSVAIAMGSTVFFMSRLPAGVAPIVVGGGTLMLAFIVYQARTFLGLDRHLRW